MGIGEGGGTMGTCVGITGADNIDSCNCPHLGEQWEHVYFA